MKAERTEAFRICSLKCNEQIKGSSLIESSYSYAVYSMRTIQISNGFLHVLFKDKSIS